VKDHTPRKLTIIINRVKLVKDSEGTMFAAKIYKGTERNHTEFEILKTLNSDRIIKVYEYKEKGKITPPNIGEKSECAEKSYIKYKNIEISYMVMELADNGELFDYLEICGSFSEKIARYYFRCLVEAIEYCHSHGLIHRDIKLQNILVAKDYSIKLSDFGLSSKESKTPSHYLGTIR
jgi:serine/threonine protein kinase